MDDRIATLERCIPTFNPTNIAFDPLHVGR